MKTGKSECRCANGSGTPFNTGNNTDGSKCTQREPASVECGLNAGNIGGRQCKCNSTDASGSNIIFIAKPDGTNNCPTPASTPAPATVNCGPNAGNIGGRQCKCNSTDASGSNIIFIAKPDGTNNCPTPASTPAPATVNCGPNAGNIGGRQCKCNSTDASGSNIIFIAKPDGTNNCPTPASTPAPATVNCGPNAGNIGGRQCKCNSTDASGSNIIFIAKPDGTNNCPTPASTPAPQCGNHAGLIAGSSTTCQCRHLSRYGDTRFKTFPSNTNGNCPVNAPEAPSDPGAATPGGTPAGGAGTPPLGAPGETSAGGTGGGPSLNPVVPGAAGPSTNEEDPACPNWHRWGKCAGKKGAIKKLLCKNPKKCALSGGTPLENKRGKNQCLQALEDLQKFIKEIKALEEEQKTLLAEVEDIDETLRAIRTGTEADYCENCDLKRLEQLKNIIDPAPSAWQTLGNVLGTVGSAALGLYGVRSANKLRDRQGFAAQPGYAVNLAMPFIMKGLYGGGLFGKSSSLACSPTLNPGGGNVFGNPFLMQQMMQAQQQQYMQQMYLMRIFQSSGQMVPGLQGGMMVPGLQGGMMGNMMVPGFQGGMMGNMMAPGFQGNIMGSLPGFQGNIVAGWMISSMTPSFQGGMMGNMMVPGFQGGMMGPGGMMGQMMGGGMQSYFQYQQAMMAWRQAQMADQMQRYQATSGLRMQIQQLQMQMYNILNGGGSYTGGMTTTTTTGGGGGGGRTNTSGGTTDGEVIIRGI